MGIGLGLALAGAVLLIPALVILLQAAVAGLAAAGLAVGWASLGIGGAALLIGLALLAIGISRLKASRLVPNKTIEQLQFTTPLATQQMRSDHDRDQAVVDFVAARLLIIGDQPAKGDVLLGKVALVPPRLDGRSCRIGYVGPRENSGCGEPEGAAKYRTPGHSLHERFPSPFVPCIKQAHILILFSNIKQQRRPFKV
jgi:Putative Actinobacterial Holin-X, holin superfamily III